MSDVPRPSTAGSPAPPTPHAWQPISARDRRVLGVLVEKAKTTPDVYPMSINAIRTGANQKNNRHPLMELENDDVEQSLERLRGLKAVSEVQGDSRVPRYRHLLYDWLGVDKLELAVMAELLLRGAQTEGDLRAHAARMEPIPDLETLHTVVAALKAKGLMLGLTPSGRGHVVTHALYQEQELEKLRAEYRGRGDEAPDEYHAPAGRAQPAPAAIPQRPSPGRQSAGARRGERRAVGRGGRAAVGGRHAARRSRPSPRGARPSPPRSRRPGGAVAPEPIASGPSHYFLSLVIAGKSSVRNGAGGQAVLVPQVQDREIRPAVTDRHGMRHLVAGDDDRVALDLGRGRDVFLSSPAMAKPVSCRRRRPGRSRRA